MNRERPHAGRPAERVQLHGEQHVGGLGLPVRLPLVVAVLKLDVVPADAGAPVPAGRHRDHPAAARRDQRPEPVDQREMTKVVGRELRLPAVADPSLWAGHDPGAVDDDVDRAAGVEQALRELGHAGQVTKVKGIDLHAIDVSD